MTTHRYVCEVLTEMRTYIKTLSDVTSRNKNYMTSLVEEAQTYVNRMEAALYYHDDIDRLHDMLKVLEEDKKKIKGEVDKLKSELPPKEVALKDDDEDDDIDRFSSAPMFRPASSVRDIFVNDND